MAARDHKRRVFRQKPIYARADLKAPPDLVAAVRNADPDAVAAHLAENADWGWADHLFIAACRVPGYEGHGGQIAEADKREDERIRIVELFVEHGAPPMVANKRKVTPLHMACRFDLPRVSERLISLGARVDAFDAARETPLYRAVNLGYVDCVRVLLAAFPNVNFQNLHGDTPLLRAVRRGKRRIVPLLLEAGANPRIPDRLGNAPLHYVRNKQIRQALEAALKSTAR